MSFDYPGIAATAAGLIANAGEPMVLRRTTVGLYDPVTGVQFGNTTQDLATTGVFTKIDTAYALTNQVQAGDRMVILDASQAPQMSDKLVVGDAVYQIVQINPVSPAGVPVIYKLQARA